MKKTFRLIAVLTLLLSLNACRSADEFTASPTVTEPTAEQTLPAAEITAPPTEAVSQPVLSFVEVWREGECSQIPVQIIRGTVGGYTIAMDPEYFTFEAHETVDLFAYDAWPGEQAVYYAISAYEKPYDPEQFIADIRFQFEHSYASWYSEETAIGQYPATLVCLESQMDAPACHRHIFLVDCGEECYVIETEFYAEMYEGLYAIMRALFDTFTPI